MKRESKVSVRMNIEAKRKLEVIQSKTKRSQTALLDRAVALLDYEILSQQMAEDLADLSSDPVVLASYNALIAAFDGQPTVESWRL
ncbi:MAG: hypothetical protein P4L53_17980 [Candidatus Obscuribacterales bacterium]|nr:hypothetical protein [Candidatus Obscuribacterales bacterium]